MGRHICVLNLRSLFPFLPSVSFVPSFFPSGVLSFRPSDFPSFLPSFLPSSHGRRKDGRDGRKGKKMKERK
jgi:hypothetical protein